MRFDWERFLRSHHIDYAYSTKRQIALRCPFCGESDLGGDNMSVNLDGKGWRCWRVSAQHYGRSPVGLVQQLLGCSREEAHRLVGGDGPPPPPTEDVLVGNRAALARLRGATPVSAGPRRLALPSKAHPLTVDDPRAEPFVRYMEDVRGYRRNEVRWLAETYDLHWAKVGPWAWRLIFPVKDRQGNLLTWTARAIGERTEPKYKQPLSADVVTEAPRTLLGLDRLWAAPAPRVLVVCEGPFDATRISVSGAPMGVWGTCLFGLGLTGEQCVLVAELAARLPQVALLVDPDANMQRIRMVRALMPLQVELPTLPPGTKDPGALTAAQATSLCLDLLST